MNRRERISTELAGRFTLDHLDVVNESGGHNVPANSETHFKVVLVSDEFAPMRRLERHRAVNAVLEAELASGLHALAIHTYTADEWRARFGEAPLSPPCLGGDGTLT